MKVNVFHFIIYIPRWPQLITHSSSRWLTGKKETAKSLCFKNGCWSKNQAQANWSRWRHPSHCHSNQSSAESGQIQERSWPQIEPDSDWKYCTTWWKPFFCYVRVGTTFDQASLRGFGQCGTKFWCWKVLKKIFGNGYGRQETELYNLVQAMTPVLNTPPEVMRI